MSDMMGCLNKSRIFWVDLRPRASEAALQASLFEALIYIFLHSTVSKVSHKNEAVLADIVGDIFEGHVYSVLKRAFFCVRQRSDQVDIIALLLEQMGPN